MPRLTVPSRSHVWSRIAVLALVGVSVAGCADSARFDSNPFASNRQASPSREVTGSIGSRPMYRSVETQPLPAPSRPAAVAASGGYGGYASGAQGLGAYRPNADVTGSVPERHASLPPPLKPAGHWTWDGGSPVTVGRGETVDIIARKYGVPAWAILQTNGIRNGVALRPGERVVIPRYVAGDAPRVQAPRVAAVRTPVQASVRAPVAATAAAATGDVHIVQPGESLIGIARHHGLSLSALARANHLQPFTKVNIGDRIVLPAGSRRQVAERQVRPSAPRVVPPRSAPPVERVATIPAQNVRMATQEPQTTESVVKSAEAAGGMPSFRWPVRGRIIASFGPKTNGTQNDGINLAVPEGTPIKAADAGVVAYAGNELKGYGNLVLIRHANGFVSAYANASELLVKRGDTVKRGQVIAHAGQTGNVSSPQLHFEIRKGSTPVDPTKYLSGA
jgi:murein DD-endopeptidase MepM/ murein hydrolase activator NlpD